MRALDDVRMRSRRKVERIRVTSLAPHGTLLLVPLFRTDAERELWAFDGVVPAAQEILMCPEDWAWVVRELGGPEQDTVGEAELCGIPVVGA